MFKCVVAYDENDQIVGMYKGVIEDADLWVSMEVGEGWTWREPDYFTLYSVQYALPLSEYPKPDAAPR